MKLLITLLSLSLNLLSAVSSPAPQTGSDSSDADSALGNLGTFVPLRIEGARRTIFEGFIFTRGHNITTASGGNHHCDGTNHGEHRFPGPTATSALADAARKQDFGFDGTFFDEFDDFLITTIGGDAQNEDTNQFWGLLVNFFFSPVGGCQTRATPFTRVLWAFDAFNTFTFLSLDGPKTARFGQTVTLTVRNGTNNALNPIEGASVGGGFGTTGADGTVRVRLTSRGVNTFKAEKVGTIRSNALSILVV